LGGGATFDLPDSEPGNCQPIRRFNPLAPEKLKDQVDSLLPRVDFPDAILELRPLSLLLCVCFLHRHNGESASLHLWAFGLSPGFTMPYGLPCVLSGEAQLEQIRSK
jgi:hypothetical protein